MKISLNWLKEYIQITKDSQELVKELKLHTTDVETFEIIRNKVSNIIVGQIKNIDPHPELDNLLICKVDIGKDEIILVTADSTVNVGDKVPVALPGAVLNDGTKIEEKSFKGIVSQGMMCSLKELGISEEAEKIYRITDSVKAGTDFVNYFELSDEIIDLEILPNRPDLLSYLGVAKELQAIGCGKDFKMIEYTQIKKGKGFPVEIRYNKCKRYMATVVKNIKVGPSPLWLIKKLGSAGIRSINNVVDITNYVMLETGHPIHAFDLDLIENQIIVRKALKGEKILLLDGKEYTMMGEETLITDGKNILALGGIMGGELSGINENTKSILLEVAYFDPINIRLSSSYHKIVSDSSYRFERGVDPNDAEIVMGRLIKLITELVGGEVDTFTTDVYPEIISEHSILLRKNYLEERLGISIENVIVSDILNRLNFKFNCFPEGWSVSVPTNRPDITQEVDLVEEVGRIYGYSNIPSTFPFTKGLIGSKGDFVTFKERIADIMLSNGYHEAKTFPLNSAKRMWMDEKLDLKIINPLSSEYEYISSKLIYGILESASFNYRNQNKDIKLFEIDKVFMKDENSPTGAKEFTNLAFVAIGRENDEDFTDKRLVSFYTVKGALENVANEFNLKLDYERSSLQGLMKSQSADIYLNHEKIGYIGLLDVEIAEVLYEIKDPIYMCEINLDILFNNKKEIQKMIRRFDFPAIKREYAFLVPMDVEFKEISEILENGGEIIEEYKIFDVYKGKNISPNYISITVSVIYRSQFKTLTDEEVNKVEQRILEQLKEKKISLREK
jgi:phenylalanyl-tRNA synthetase beta chain